MVGFFFAVYFFMDIIEESQIVKNIKIPAVCLSMILEHPIYSGDSDVEVFLHCIPPIEDYSPSQPLISEVLAGLRWISLAHPLFQCQNLQMWPGCGT